jgi:hypothetical protein
MTDPDRGAAVPPGEGPPMTHDGLTCPVKIETTDTCCARCGAVECPECCGDGLVEVLKACSRRISDCCGGCTKLVECETCGGTGRVLE